MCAATNVVFGLLRNRLSRSAISSSNCGSWSRRIAAVREERQLEPALVGVVDRLEELLRIGGVDEHRHARAARHASQIGSSSGSSSCEPRCRRPCVVDRPKPLPISPTPTAPAATSASSCWIAFSAQPGPTFRKSMPVSTRTRSFCGDAWSSASVRVSRSPEMLSAATISRTFRLSSDAIRLARPSADPSCRGWPWKSIAGNFAFGFRCAARDERRFRPVVEDARRRHARAPGRSRPHFGGARRALFAGLNLDPAAAALASAACRGRSGCRACGRRRPAARTARRPASPP